MLFGVDHVTNGATLVGVYGSYAWLNAGADRARSPAVGLYFGLPLAANLLLNGHVGYAAPRYNFGGPDVASDRVMAALQLSGSWQVAAVLLTSGVSVSGYDEVIPAHSDGSGTIARDASQYWTASANVRATATAPIGPSGLTPYLDASLGRAQVSSSLSGDASFSIGRMAIGVLGTIGAGTLSAEIGSGQVLKDMRATQVSMEYALRF